MPRHDNYPDDIHQYDHHQQSPFFVEPDEDAEDPDDDGDHAYDRWKDEQMEKDLNWDTPTHAPFNKR